MGSAICELVSEKNPVPVIRVGVNDSFGQSGTPEQLVEKYGLGHLNIVAAIEKVVKLKNARKS
jgi:transketolase